MFGMFQADYKFYAVLAGSGILSSGFVTYNLQ